MQPTAEYEFRRGTIAALADDWDTALAAFRNSLALDPSLVDAKLHIFDVLVSSSRDAEADAMVSDLLRDHGRDQSFLVAIADLRERQGRYDEALELIGSRYVDPRPTSSAYPVYLRILIGAQRWDQAALDTHPAWKTSTLWRSYAQLARVISLLSFREYALACEVLAGFDALELAGLVCDWADQYKRSGAIEAIRKVLTEGADALPENATLRTLCGQFGAG